MNRVLTSLIVAIFLLPVAAQNLPSPSLPKNYLPLPVIRQATSYSCGAAAMLSVLTYWQLIDSGESGLYADLGTTEENGTSPLRIYQYGRKLGLKARWSLQTSLADLRRWVAEGETVIVDFQAWRENKKIPWKDLWDDGHYAVVVGFDDAHIYLMDPSTAAGYAYIPIPEFEERWRDYEIENGQEIRHYRLALSFKGEKALKEYPRQLTYLE